MRKENFWSPSLEVPTVKDMNVLSVNFANISKRSAIVAIRMRRRRVSRTVSKIYRLGPLETTMGKG